MVTALVLGLGSASGAIAEPIPKQAVTLMQQLDALSANATLSDAQRTKAFLTLTEAHFDVPVMAANGLPRALRPTGEDWTRYLVAFRSHLAQAFLQGVRQNGQTRSHILGARERPDGSSVVFLETNAGASDWRSTWILCPTPTFRICDVELDGVRMSGQHRRRFGAVIERDGFDAFINALHSGTLVPE